MSIVDIFWFQIGFELFIVIILISLGLKSKNYNLKINDENIIKIVRKKLLENGYDNFELNSIITLDNPKITSVVVTAGYQEIALEIDMVSGKILTMERIAR